MSETPSKRPETSNKSHQVQSKSVSSEVFGIKQNEPQKTHKNELKKLDKLIENYKLLYNNEGELTIAQLHHSQQIKQMQDILKLKNHIEKQQDLKQDLEQQIKMHQLIQTNQRLNEIAADAQVTRQFAENDNLFMIFPKMYAKPTYKAREDELENQKEIAATLQRQIREKETRHHQIQSSDKIQYLEQMHKVINDFDEQKRQIQLKKETLRSSVIKELDEQKITKHLQAKILQDSKLLQNEIVYGELSTLKPKEKKSPENQNLQNIFYSQRKKAEKRAIKHGQKTDPTKCHFVELDPKPDLPLDHMIWGNPALIRIPQTSYSQAFQDPREVLEHQLAIKQAVKNHRLDDYLLQTLKDQTKDEDEISQMSSTDQNPVDKEGGIDGTDDQPQLEPEKTEQLEDTNKLDQDQIEKIKSEIDKISNKISAQSKGNRSVFSTFSKQAKKDECDIFESKSLVSLRTSQTKSQKSHEHNLKKLTQTALQKENLKNEPVNQDQQSYSVGSSFIRRRINEMAYNSLVLNKKNEQNKEADKSLTVVRQRAQEDAIMRVFKEVEKETIQQKRIAEERRALNQTFDDKKEQNFLNQKQMRIQLDAYQKVQVMRRKRLEYQEMVADKKVPHISGNQGYPYQAQPTDEELRHCQQTQQAKVAEILDQQIIMQNQKRKETIKANKKQDQEYLAGFKVANTAAEVVHTTGNIGQIPTVTQEEIDRKKLQEKHNQQIWIKEQQLQNLKTKVYRDQKMIIHEDKLDEIVEQTAKKLAYIKSATNFYRTPQSQSVRNSQINQKVGDLLSNQLNHDSNTPRANTRQSGNLTLKQQSTQASNFLKPSADNVSVLEKLSEKINKKPQTPTQNLKRYQTKDSIVKGDEHSAWSQIGSEMIENEGTRALDFPQKMDRRRKIATEHAYRRGAYKSSEQKHPFAMTQKELDEKGDENVQFPWEQREESFRQYRDLLAQKPGK